MQEPHTITVLNFPDNKVTVEFLSSTPTLPLVVTPLIKDLDLIAWGQANQSRLDRYLQQFGAILFRDFFISDVMAFENFLNTIAGNLLEYQYWQYHLDCCLPIQCGSLAHAGPYTPAHHCNQIRWPGQ